MVAVTLVYFNAGGSEVFTALPVEDDCSTIYLPDNPMEDALVLSPDIDAQHSSLCLEVHHAFVLLRTFNNTTGSCYVLGDGGVNIELPPSTASHHKSIILSTDVHFLGPSGRWGLRWDNMDGTGSNSMRPPPLPLVANCTETSSAVEDRLHQPVDVEAVARVESSQDQSGDSTCSPTPSPENDGDGHENRAKETETLEEVSGDSKVLDMPQGVLCTVKEDQPKKLNAVSDNAQATPGIPSAPEQEPRPDQCFSGAVERVALHDRHPRSVGDTANPPSCSPSTQDLFQDEDDATALLASEKRGAKRKLTQIQSGDSSLQTTQAQSSPLDAGVVVVDTITSTNSVNKKTQTARRKIQVTKTSTRQSRAHQPSTATKTSSDKTEQPSFKRRPTRRTESASPRDYSGPAPVVIFSGSTSIQEKGTAMESFERLGGKVGTTINKATILCIPEGPLKKTGKLIMAVATGMDIVTEKWIADTHRLGRFPALEGYLPLDRSRERQWDFNLKDAVSRGKTGLTHLLSGTTVFLTKQLRTDLGNLEREISQIATILGADAVKHRLPALKDKGKFSEAETLIIGMSGDPQGAHVRRLGLALFNKDILIMAALRGRVERASADFRIEVPIKDEVEDV